MTERHNNLDWEIGDLPIGSSTPDEFFEMDYRASTKCPECGYTLHGVAHYWSRHENMIAAWLNDISYEPCECDDEKEEDWDYEDDEDDFKPEKI